MSFDALGDGDDYLAVTSERAVHARDTLPDHVHRDGRLESGLQVGGNLGGTRQGERLVKRYGLIDKAFSAIQHEIFTATELEWIPLLSCVHSKGDAIRMLVEAMEEPALAERVRRRSSMQIRINAHAVTRLRFRKVWQENQQAHICRLASGIAQHRSGSPETYPLTERQLSWLLGAFLAAWMTAQLVGSDPDALTFW